MILTVIQLKPAPLVVTIQGNDVRLIANTPSEGGAGVTAHSQLTGLGNDDHTQYYNTARGDARYEQVSRKVTAFSTPTDTQYPSAKLVNDTIAALSSSMSSSLANKADLVGGVVPNSQIPAIAITEYLGVAANQAAMLALSGQKGDWCVRTDLSKVYVITGNDPTQLADWTALVYPSSGAVWGAITGTLSDQTDLWTQLGLKSNVANPVFTGNASITGQSLTGSQTTALVYGSSTWNTSGIASLLEWDLTDTASNSASLLMNIKRNGNSLWRIRKDGVILLGSSANPTATLGAGLYNGEISFHGGNAGYANANDYSLSVRSDGFHGFAATTTNDGNSTKDVRLYRDMAGVLALRNSTNAQALRIYNTYNGTNDEYGFLRWVSNVLEIGTTKTGSGTERGLRIKTSTGQLEFDDANGWISRTAASNTMQFSPSGNTAAMSLTAGTLNPGFFASSNFTINGCAAHTAVGTFTIQAVNRGGNTGVGHAVAVVGGGGSTATTGTAGGAASLTGGAAGGSGNNNGGGVDVSGGAPTGSGTYGRIRLLNVPTSSAGLTTGMIWNNSGVLNIV